MIYSCFSPPSLITSFVYADSMYSSCRVILEDSVAIQSMKLTTYVELFILTCLLEAPIYWYGLRRTLGNFQMVGAILILNLVTHPTVTWIFPWVFSGSSLLTRDYILVSELAAMGAEAFLLATFYRVRFRRAFLVSICANLFSWWAGLYVAAALGLP